AMTKYTYSGTVEGTYDTATVWNGTGTVVRGGLLEPVGTVTATTTDELEDNTVCSGQPSSGQTSIEAGDHTAVITYDGATMCSAMHLAKWSVDGVDKGTVDGVTCAASRGPGAPGLGAGALGLAAVLVARRRARRLGATR